MTEKGLDYAGFAGTNLATLSLKVGMCEAEETRCEVDLVGSFEEERALAAKDNQS